MSRRPSSGNIVYPYGMRWHPILQAQKMHWGEDIGWGNNAGFTLVAPQDARILAAQDRGNYGIRVDLGDGAFEHRLAHTYGLVTGLRVGDWVREGQPVAIMGDTGLAEGRHVHWEVLEGGKLMDPAQWLTRTASSGGLQPFPPSSPTPIPEEEDDMKRQIVMRPGDTPEWSLLGADIMNGRRVTTSQATANAWALQYGPAKIAKDRDEYVRAQREALADHQDYLSVQRLILKP